MDFNNIANFKFITALQNSGAGVFLVGGIVRDHFLCTESKDIDLVIRNLSIHKIMTILQKFGKLTETTVADKMGVLKFVPIGIDLDEAIDIALPRTERLMTDTEVKAEGITNAYNAFMVNSDPNLSIEKDLERRDFTINSMAVNLATMKLVDPFNGQSDLLDKTIRHTNDQSFSDDPLRMFRAVQFASRFEGFAIHDETAALIVNNKHKATTISAERVRVELQKIFDKGDISKGVRILESLGLHSVLFPARTLEFGTDTIITQADFFFHICGSADSFKTVLRGDNETAKGIDAIILANSFNEYKSLSSISDMAKARLGLFHALKKSQGVLDSGKLLAMVHLARDEFQAGKFPKSMDDLAATGEDLKKLGVKQGRELGQMLQGMLEDVMNGTPNDKETLLGRITKQLF